MDGSYASVDAMAGALTGGLAGRELLSNSALHRGAGFLQKGRHDDALREFRLAAGYAPDAPNVRRLIGQTFALMGRTDEAAKAYREALRIDPTFVAARSDLASLLLTSKRYDEAEKELRTLLGTGRDAGTVASLGYVYLETGRAAQAAEQFQRAVRLAPADAAGYYSLGLARRALGDLAEAAVLHERAIALRPDYAAARAELGHVRLALGDQDAAREQLDALYRINTEESVSYAFDLLHDLRRPGIAYLDITGSTFNPLLGPHTPVASLDPALATPGAGVTMTMTFVFNQDMDAASVMNPYNWSIRRAAGGAGGVYNHGVDLDPGRQVTLAPIPLSVRYDPETRAATIAFRVTQNAAGDGVLDPSHWVFTFSGTGADGRAMDPDADEFDWWARGAF